MFLPGTAPAPAATAAEPASRCRFCDAEIVKVKGVPIPVERYEAVEPQPGAPLTNVCPRHPAGTRGSHEPA